MQGQQQEIVEQAHPQGKLIEPEEVAEAFIYLCSVSVKSSTDVILPIEGGSSVQ